MLACRDGSLVSLFRLDGARSMMGARELDGFIELGARRLNSVFTGPGHALHVVFERAPDEAARLVAAAGGQTLRQCERLGLALGDVIAERGRRLVPLMAAESFVMAAESFVMAAWTRPSVLAPDQVKRDLKRLGKRFHEWLPEASESQCPYLAPDGLAPRHEALPRFPCGAVRGCGNSGRGAWQGLRVCHPAPFAERLGLDRTGLAPCDGRQRRTGAPDRTARGWRVPAAAGAATADPRSRTDWRPESASAERVYGALDMALGPRRTRPVLRTDGAPWPMPDCPAASRC